MRQLLVTIAEAFAYFSAVPVPRAYAQAAPSPRSLSALTLVGAFIGAAAGAAGYGISLVSSPFTGRAVAFALVVLLSGAIHVDGFLDSCDALFACATPARRLEILKDPRHGTYAVAGMAILVVLWLAALSGTALSELPLRLAFACTLARAAAIVPTFVYHYARKTPSSALAERPRAAPIVIAIAALTAASILISSTAWITIPISIIAALGLARWSSAQLGGLVGDSYGFIITLLEPSVTMALALHGPRPS